MKVAINDTNILIDLVHLDLLAVFFQLSFEFYTTDFVIEELTDSTQKEAIDEFINSEKLLVHTFEGEQIIDIVNLKTKNLSITDCSVLYLTQ